MVKKKKDVQLMFDFPGMNEKAEFITVKGTCTCGYEYTFKKSNLVIEMTALCPNCSAVIKVD